jgi:hypothetical protein
VPLLKFVSIEGFMKGIILFQWPWRCTTHLGVIWIVSSRSVHVFSTIDDQEVSYPYHFAFNQLSLSFCIQFCRQHVSIAFQHALIFVIERKIALADHACSRPPITIRSHDLHADDIRGVVGEITSYHERD